MDIYFSMIAEKPCKIKVFQNFAKVVPWSDGRSCKIIQLYCCPFYAKLWIDTSEQHTLFINRMIGVISWN